MNYYNVFCKQFDRNEHFPPFEHSLAAIRSASESIQPVQIVWVGLNSNWVRLMKSSVTEPGLRKQARFNALLFLGLRGAGLTTDLCIIVAVVNLKIVFPFILIR